MCLADRVLVYGDCAVNPNPTRRAAGRHRDLLGGDRGAVRDRAAGGDARPTRPGRRAPAPRSSGCARPRSWCARARRSSRSRGRSSTTPRSTPAWRAPSCRSSDVAGRATVFIFPDLNTGNNTYKAVQRSANAIADRPGPAGPQQAGQRPLARRDRARHRQHGRDHGDPGGRRERLRRQLRLVVAEVVGGRRRRRARRSAPGRSRRSSTTPRRWRACWPSRAAGRPSRPSRTASCTAASASPRRC